MGLFSMTSNLNFQDMVSQWTHGTKLETMLADAILDSMVYQEQLRWYLSMASARYKSPPSIDQTVTFIYCLGSGNILDIHYIVQILIGMTIK
jgi:hypothetical protein